MSDPKLASLLTNVLTDIINRFTEWAKKYGGLYSLKMGTGTAVVITDRRIVKEAIDKKSAKYSNRPNSYLIDVITGGDHLLVMQYGQLWRTFRKLVHQHFMESMVEKSHVKVQNAEAVQMLHDFVVRPDQHMRHPKRYSNSITMSLVWGVRTPEIDTPHMTELYEMMVRIPFINTDFASVLIVWYRKTGLKLWNQEILLQ